MSFWAEVGSAPHFLSHQAWVYMGFAVKLANSVRTLYLSKL
jgi:hypothetical protein